MSNARVLAILATLSLSACGGDTGGEQPASCKATSDCKDAAAPKCNAATSTCVACLVASDCAAGKTCRANACVANDSGCVVHAECGAGRHCERGACAAGCADKTTCAAPTPACDTASGACVACVLDDDCGDVTRQCTDFSCAPKPECAEHAHCGANKHCEGGFCLPGCADDSTCAAPAPFCHLVSGACVACLRNEDCGDATLVCTGSSCVAKPECSSDSDCAGLGKQPHCSTAGLCSWQCLDGDECSGGQVCQDHFCTTPPSIPLYGDCTNGTCDPGLFCAGASPITARKVCLKTCTLPADCGAGFFCTAGLPGFPTGFCAQTCTTDASGCFYGTECRAVTGYGSFCM